MTHNQQRNLKNLLTAACALGFTFPAVAADFHPISSASVNTSGSDLWPASNLIQGPGAGYGAAEPHDQLGGGSTHRWVTEACGFPCDYYLTRDVPVIELDLGADVDLSEISTWGYAATNSNGVSRFSLRFATEADGAAGFGNSISYHPTFSIPNNDVVRMNCPFGATVRARYVEFTCVDNHFVPPGDGSAGETPGGDRIGLGEIAFAVPEPSSFRDIILPSVVGAIQADHTVPGVLETGDSLFGDDTFIDTYALYLPCAATISIEMASTDFDTYLLLADSDGNVLETNDNCDGSTQLSCIRDVALDSGLYFLTANTFSAGENGAYTLSVTGGSVAIGLNFSSDREAAALLPGEKAGVIPTSNWNNWDGIPADPVIPPVTGTQADIASPLAGAIIEDRCGAGVEAMFMTVNWQSANSWNTDNGTSDPDNKLMNGYIDNNADFPDTPAIEVFQLPQRYEDRGYSVIAYFGSDHNARMGTIGLQGRETFSFSTFSQQSGDFPAMYARTTDTAGGNPNANYARWDGLYDAFGFILNHTRGSDNSGIHAVQIVLNDGYFLDALSGQVTVGETVAGALVGGDAQVTGLADQDDSGAYLDSYLLHIEQTVALDIALTADVEDSPDTYLFLADFSGTLVAENDDGGAGVNSRLWGVVLTPGIYFIGCSSYDSGETGSYTLSVSQLPGGSGVGFPQSGRSIEPIALGESVPGILEAGDSLKDGDIRFEDLYRFYLIETTSVRIDHMASPDFNALLFLYDSGGNEIAVNDDCETVDSCLQLNLPPGQYFIGASQLGTEGLGAYNLSLNEMPVGAGFQQPFQITTIRPSIGGGFEIVWGFALEGVTKVVEYTDGGLDRWQTGLPGGIIPNAGSTGSFTDLTVGLTRRIYRIREILPHTGYPGP